MELQIVEFPSYVEELSVEFRPLFDQERQANQFKRLMTGFVMAEQKNIAHMNGLFTYHTNQSNLNRFVTSSDWNQTEMSRIQIGMINEVEHKGIVVLDDYVVEKYGTEIYGVDWHRDHAKKRNVWGLQIADCVLSGKGIYPLLSTVYLRKKSRWLTAEGFRSKIEIQKEHLTRLVELQLHFSCAVMDNWYFCKTLTQYIEQLGKDWVAQSKTNRLVKFHGRWVALQRFAQTLIQDKNTKFRVVQLGDNTYMMKAVTIRMNGMGVIRLLLSLNDKGNFKFYVTNRLDWDEIAMITRYSRRWDIEVWHREGKGRYGIEDCQLRCNESVSKHLTLNAVAVTLLEIASLLSPVYAILTKQGRTPEMKHRWILAELVGQLISSVQNIGDKEVKQIIEGILCPYKSTIVKQIVV